MAAEALADSLTEQVVEAGPVSEATEQLMEVSCAAGAVRLMDADFETPPKEAVTIAEGLALIVPALARKVALD